MLNGTHGFPVMMPFDNGSHGAWSIIIDTYNGRGGWAAGYKISDRLAIAHLEYPPADLFTPNTAFFLQHRRFLDEAQFILTIVTCLKHCTILGIDFPMVWVTS
nr:hypothetical protein [Paenibacillus sp. 1_12]